jgi:hypothetical protein
VMDIQLQGQGNMAVSGDAGPALVTLVLSG